MPEVELPQPYWWPEPITLEQFAAFTPEKLELVGGYLLHPEARQERLNLVALLLRNCGLEHVVPLACVDHWREAFEHNGISFYE